jgi:hypothetical protein
MKPRTYEYEQILEHDGMMLQASLYQWLMLPAALVLAASVSHAEDDPIGSTLSLSCFVPVRSLDEKRQFSGPGRDGP